MHPVPMVLCHRSFASLFVLAGLALLGSACGERHSPDLLLITFDTARYDRFGTNGDTRASTPSVDALAAGGLVFDRAYASVPITLPSHATILSGLEPNVHGVGDNSSFRVPEQIELLPERLARAGYETAAFVSALVLGPETGIDQGFGEYGIQTRRRADPLDLTVPQRAASEVTDDALAWLAEREGDAPIFLWAHYYDPHLPRDLEPPFDAMPDAYRAEIAYADAELGRLLAGLDAARAGRQRWTVFTADHGESLGEHGEMTHALLAYDSSLHVPLVISGPGLKPGRSDTRVGHADLVPTLLVALGLPAPPELPGRDMLRLPRSGGGDEALGYFECLGPHLGLGWAPIRGVRTQRWKYTAEPLPAELYDVLVDPGETRNLAESRPEVGAELARAYTERVASVERLPSAPLELDADASEQLAALGYVEARTPDVSAAPHLDPRRFVTAHGWVSRARSLARAGQYDRAIEVLETLAESDAIRVLALRALAPIYAQTGRFEESEASYRRYLELTGAEEARLGLARTLLRSKRPQSALSELERLERPSTRSETLRAYALVDLNRRAEARAVVQRAMPDPHQEELRLRTEARLWLRGDAPEEAEARLRELLSRRPGDPELRSRLGTFLLRSGSPAQFDEGLALLRAAAEAAPTSAELQSLLAWGLSELGREAEALTTYESVLELDPTRQGDRARLAGLLARRGQSAEALELLQRALTVQPAARWSDEARALEARLSQALGDRKTES